jgi:hypothetical protein
MWRFDSPRGVTKRHLERSRWNAELERWEFRAPQGEVMLSGSGLGYDHESQKVRVGLGTNEFVLQLRGLTGLTVLLREGTTEIPWDPNVFPILDPAEGQQVYNSYISGSGALTLKKKEPGLYLLKVPELQDYELIPNELVRLERGIVKKHVIQLVRRP